MRRLTLLAAAVLASGCYTYTPITTRAVAEGKIVRVELTDAGSTSVTSAIGSQVLWVEGDVRDAGETRLTLALRTVGRRDFGESAWNGETLTLAGGDIRFVTERVRSRSRTAWAVSLIAAGSVAIVYSIARAAGQASGGSGRPDPTPP